VKIKKGDTVVVTTGRTEDKGKSGKVIAVYPESQRILVEGCNMVKKHTKISQTQRGAKTGGIITQEAPIHVSNVMLVDDETGKPTRVGYRKEEHSRPSGATKVRKIRVSKRSGKDI
jgi:large subunit ribosomal protein L24